MHSLYRLLDGVRIAAHRHIGTTLASAFVVVAIALSGRFVVGQIFQAFPRRAQPGGLDSGSGVYLPMDRSLSRAITRAKERLADHEYHDVLAFLQQILARDEDSFLERVGDDRQQLGLKATARQLIGELPPEGRDAYELLNGATARRQLDTAIHGGDREALAKVVRQFFHTAAGYEAALVLAQMEADQGHHLAAAELYRELIETPRAAARFEPQLSVAAALNFLAAGKTEEAATVLRALSTRSPSAQIMLAGKPALLPSVSADPIAWLSGLVGQPLKSVVGDADWLMLHGDSSRNSLATGGSPHLRPRWEARVVNEPAVESYLANRSDDFLQRNAVAIPGARPIAVGDIVVMRTPQNIVAVDWQTGKRIWETRDEEELQSDLAVPEAGPGNDRDQWSAQGKSLEDRVWDDALMASLASDGKRVFIVRGLSVTRDEEVAAGLQAAQIFARNGVELASATNQLAAYDIATQGKLAWELDGSRMTGKLSGAFFLGAPLAIDNTLFVMAETRQALYLIALDPATGKVQWQQQLVELEQGITLDSTRRRAGAMPSYSAGILVCPTAASTVVAIDIVKREFAWVYRYPREVADVHQMWGQPQQQTQLLRSNNQWLDNSAVIADGRVLLTPPDSSEIHCIDLRTGKLAWKRPQNDYVFLGSVDGGNALLVGAQSVQALRLSDGAPAWEQETRALPSGALPAGQGYLSEGHYFLPLTSGQVADIEVATGKLTTFEPAGANVSLGNLICHRGSVLSQSALVLAKFEQVEVLRHRTEAALARNADDPTAIRERGELMRADGQKAEAIRLVKRAYELAPDDLVTQEMLVELLLEGLATDYAAYREDVPLVTKLVHSREQQIELLRIDAAGLDASGQRLPALDAYLRLADFTAEEPAYLRLQDKFTVRSDRWISGRIASLWSEALADERDTMRKKIATRQPALENPRTAADMRHYLAHLDQLPGADEVRLALANFLVVHDRPQEAEIELLELIASGDAEAQSAASELMKKLDSKSTGPARRPPTEWPHGRVDAVVSAAAQSTPRDRPTVPLNERGQPTSYRQLRIEQDFLPQSSPMHWFVAMDFSEIVGRNTLGDDVFHLTIDPNLLAHQYRDAGLLHGATLGHLLFVALGGRPIAIDSRADRQAADNDILWPNPSTDGLNRDAARPRPGPGVSQARANHRPVYHTFGRKRIAGSTLGSLGPVSPLGVVFQEEDELRCVDPLTGVTLWSRVDIPAGCELFGDRELVFAADVSANVAYVMRLIDGQLLEKRKIPSGDWLLTAGRNIAQFAAARVHGRPGTVITVTDVWAQKTLCQVELSTLPTTSKISILEPNAIAAFEPSGQFRLIDVQSGKVTIDEKLEAVPDLQTIYAMRAGDELYLFVSTPVHSQAKPIGQPFDFPLTNGPVYAFNVKTGKSIWPSPAMLRNRGIVLSQPADVPFLVFIDQQNYRDSASGSGSRLRVLCLDKRTGETVYRNDRLQDTNAMRFRIRAKTQPQPVVALDMGGAKIELTMTDHTRPSQPPANDDREAPSEAGERGLRGLGERISGALLGELEKSSPNSSAPPQAPSKPQRVDAPSKKVPEKQTDDD